MKRTVPEFLNDYTEECLMAQSTTWDAGKWKRALTGSQEEMIDRLNDRFDNSNAITRQDLFLLSSDVRYGQACVIDLFTACTIWGAPRGNRFRGGVKSVGDILTDQTLEEKLNRTLETLDDGERGPNRAFVEFSKGGGNQIAYLGPSFFTKFLYCGLRQTL
jgi:hypothetical protein